MDVAQRGRNDNPKEASLDKNAGVRCDTAKGYSDAAVHQARPGALSGMVTLQSDLLPRGEARRADEARWAAQDRPDDEGQFAGGDGGDMIAGGASSDRLLPDHDPDAPWNEGQSANLGDFAKLSYDPTMLESTDVTHSGPDPVMASVEAMQRNRESRNVTYSRLWPVPGDGRPAKKGEIAPNGRKYSDGRFAPAGGYRGISSKTKRPKAHYGVDLPAATGTDVVAADDGIVLPPVVDRTGENFGTSVTLGYDGGAEQGLYGHLSSVQPLPIGTRVKRGQKIGKVGTSGNAKGGGDHLHYEVRQAKIDPRTKTDITWRLPSQGGRRPVYPGHRVSLRNPVDK